MKIIVVEQPYSYNHPLLKGVPVESKKNDQKSYFDTTYKLLIADDVFLRLRLQQT